MTVGSSAVRETGNVLLLERSVSPSQKLTASRQLFGL
jgi:hypothetical protein